MRTLHAFLLLAAVSLGFGPALAKNSETRPPNVVLIMADDLGWGDVGANGADMIATPNIDRLAAEGIRLTTFYARSNACTPSHAALLTGRYPIRSGMQHVVSPHSDSGLPQSEITLPELLKEAGYATGMVGKWHLGHRDKFWPTAHGFDKFTGVPYSNDLQPFDLYHHKTVVQSPVQQTELTDRYAAAASDFIARHRKKPFFLYYAETFPHFPLHVPDESEGTSKAGLYGDVVAHLDEGIGRIMAALEANGVAENTLVILTSDNGPWFEGDQGDFRGRKGGTYEGGFRVPFIARLPGRIPAGSVSDAMAMNIDLLPTIAAIAGLDRPSDRVIDGRDISGVLTERQETPHEAPFFFDGNNIVSIRDERYRIVMADFYRSFPIPFEQFGAALLFDLQRDPQERFSYLRELPEVHEALMARITKMRGE
ncbi:MAG: sulfatase, partial [Erythrobacter sp.]|nr:sulfatase [Erythrobacter sp.]